MLKEKNFSSQLDFSLNIRRTTYKNHEIKFSLIKTS